MPMQSTLLAKQLWDLNGPVLDGNSAPQGPTPAILDYAKGIVEMLKAALTAHLPGTVSGSAAPGAPLTGGAANGGKFLAVVPAIMSAIASKSNPTVAPQVILEATAIAAYVLEAALIVFAAGGISGNSTESPAPSPGPLAAGAGAQGKITALVGSALSARVKALTLSDGPTQVAHYTMVCTFIMTNATVTYAAGTVLGVCTGGQLTVGAAAGGVVT